MTDVFVCKADEIPEGQAVKVTIDDVPVPLAKDSAGNLHALGDVCSHGEISLSEGFVEDDTLECWAHGSKFELTTGKPQNFPAFEPVPVYKLTITDGDVYIDTSVLVGDLTETTE